MPGFFLCICRIILTARLAYGNAWCQLNMYWVFVQSDCGPSTQRIDGCDIISEVKHVIWSAHLIYPNWSEHEYDHTYMNCLLGSLGNELNRMQNWNTNQLLSAASSGKIENDSKRTAITTEPSEKLRCTSVLHWIRLLYYSMLLNCCPETLVPCCLYYSIVSIFGLTVSFIKRHIFIDSWNACNH